MFEWLTNLITSIIAFILSLLGMGSDKKSVHFADDAKDAPAAKTEEDGILQQTEPPSE